MQRQHVMPCEGDAPALAPPEPIPAESSPRHHDDAGVVAPSTPVGCRAVAARCQPGASMAPKRGEALYRHRRHYQRRRRRGHTAHRAIGVVEQVCPGGGRLLRACMERCNRLVGGGWGRQEADCEHPLARRRVRACVCASVRPAPVPAPALTPPVSPCRGRAPSRPPPASG